MEYQCACKRTDWRFTDLTLWYWPVKPSLCPQLLWLQPLCPPPLTPGLLYQFSVMQTRYGSALWYGVGGSASNRAGTSPCHQSLLFHSTVRYGGRLVRFCTIRFLWHGKQTGGTIRDHPFSLPFHPSSFMMLTRRGVSSVTGPNPTMISNEPVTLIQW